MKKISKVLSFVLCLLFVVETFNLGVLAEEWQSETVPFTDAVITEEEREQNLFLFGSTDMTVSEDSRDRYAMKLVRTGDLSSEASVTVKFTDISSNYGVNYTVEDENGTKATEEEGRISLVDFMLNNAESTEELTPTSNEELIELVSEYGFSTVDNQGNTLSNVTLAEDGEGSISVDDLTKEQTLTAEDGDAISDSFPGTVIDVVFGAGESEKLLYVKPKKSKAADGDCLAVLTLKNPSEGFGVGESTFSTYLTILDTDEGEDAVISLAETSYTAEGDSVTVTVTRSGAVNKMVSVDFCTVAGTAETGEDFQGYSAPLYFAMGITSREVTIPVRHNEDERTFEVKLVKATDCTVENGTAKVTITPAIAAEESLEALAASKQSPSEKYDAYLAPTIQPREMTVFGNANNKEESRFTFSCKGVDYDTWNGGTYRFKNAYLYDGIRITWEAVHDYIFSGSYTYINTDNRHVYYSDENEWDKKTDYVIFGAASKTFGPKNSELWLGSLTSYGFGIQVTVNSIKPIYRRFNFTLTAAEPKSFLGVDDLTASTYQTVQFAGELESTRTVNTTVGGSFTVAAPKSQTEYLRLEGLEFLDAEGNVLYFLPNKTNTRSVTVNVTEELLSELAVSTLTYTREDDGRYIGTVSVRPVFSYIDATVTVKPAEMGRFTGVFATDSKNLTLSYHVGDRVTFSTEVYAAYAGKYVADGVRYEKFDAENAKTVNGSGQLDYTGGELTLMLDTPYLTVTPTFRTGNNAVKVRVLWEDVDRGVYDTTKGIFALHNGVTREGDYNVYQISASSVHVDQLVSMSAIPSHGNRVSVWTVAGSEKTYSGDVFYLTAGRNAEDNVVTLSSASTSSLAVSGYVMNADKNLATGNSSSSPIIPATGALLSLGGESTMADEEGKFSVSARAAEGTYVRLLVYQNNVYTVKDIAQNGGKNNVGVITVATNTAESAYFTNVYFYQDDNLVTSTETLSLNGKALTLYATVKDGNRYVLNGNSYTEHVTGVTFYVLDGTTHEIKSTYEATEVEDGVFAAKIQRFNPDEPDSYYYGDCFYVSMTTDRRRADVTDENGETPEQFLSTDYAMLSTGYEIIRDANYEPQKINFNLPISAAVVLGAEGDPEATTKSYASFPFIGAIDTLVGLTGFLKVATGSSLVPDMSDDFDDDDEDNYGGANENPGGASGFQKVQFRITLAFETLPYGGTRFKFGVTAITGNSAWWTSTDYNPIETLTFLTEHKQSGYEGEKGLIHDNRAGLANLNSIMSKLGNPQMTFTLSIGFYIDFGLITTTNHATGETTGLFDSEWEFLGAGGYFGGSFGIKFQWFTIIPVINLPGYAGFIGNIGVTGYLGATKDPDKVLKYSDMLDEDGTFDVDEMHFNADIIANLSLKGFVGLGIPDVIGARIIVGVNVSFVFSPFLEDYYKQLENMWGLGVNLTVGGQIDLVFAKIPFEGFSVPVYSAGFTEYFVVLKRVYRLLEYTRQELNEKAGLYSDEVAAKVRDYCAKLDKDIEDQVTVEQLEKDFDEVLTYVYDTIHLITKTEYGLLYVITPYEIFLSGSAVETTDYEVMEHTDSSFVANYPTFMGAYSEVDDKVLVRDSYSQPSAKILDIGGGRMLVVFLLDTSDEGEVTNPTLVYTVYDTNDNSWTEPTAVQSDKGMDYTPSLCDAGDKVLITWASVSEEYDDYITDCALMRDFEIYAAFFDKATGTVGAAEQLTDDEYMDCKPSAIYDDETGNVAVYYLKNDAESEEITDYITTESLVCYRLYEEGAWVTDYYEEEYPDFTPTERHEMAVTYGGQRFLPSVTVGGEDLPITDIAVCEGYNGLAVYAYTVDMDGDSSTDADTELFLRVYDFRNHKTYKAIRITKDEASQAQPQLVRNEVPYTERTANGDVTVNGSTYLFWLENGNEVKYISVTDLIRNGIFDEEGKVRDDGKLNTNYYADPVTVNTDLDDGTQSTVSSYQALTDEKDNLYVLWTQATGEVEGNDVNTPAALEIYAVAKINDDVTVEFDGETKEGGVLGSAWSAPYRLTNRGDCNDGIYGTVSEDGKLYILHNNYTVTYIGDTEEYLSKNHVDENGYMTGNPYEISATDLKLASFEPIGTVSATEFTFSNEKPKAGETVTVTVKMENTGLTTANGYTAEFYAGKTLVSTVSSDKRLVANSAEYVSFEWTVPADFAGMKLKCVATENGYANTEITYSEALVAEAEYEVTALGVRQVGDKFEAEYLVENVGNAPSPAGDCVKVNFTGLYGDLQKVYGITDPVLATEAVSLDAGESVRLTSTLTIPECAFDYCGYDQLTYEVFDKDGKLVSNTAYNFVAIEEPMNVKFSCGSSISLYEGENANASVSMTSEFVKSRATVTYSADDPSVATVDENGRIHAVGKGSTTVTAYVAPFGAEAKLTVSVNAKDTPSEEKKPSPVIRPVLPIVLPAEETADEPEQTPTESDSPIVIEIEGEDTPEMRFADVTADSYYYNAVLWATENGLTAGKSDTLFAPFDTCTRAELVTFLWRLAGCPEVEESAVFTDVERGSWYEKAVAWAVSEGITNGVGEGLFRPMKTVTRAEAVTFLYRYAKATAPVNGEMFTDVDENAYYAEAVQWAQANGITEGVSKNSFAPDAVCTRAQIVTFLYRFGK